MGRVVVVGGNTHRYIHHYSKIRSIVGCSVMIMGNSDDRSVGVRVEGLIGGSSSSGDDDDDDDDNEGTVREDYD